VLEVGDLVVDIRARTAVLAGRSLDLRPREFDLLAYLAARPGEVVSKRTLLAEVWQSPYGGADKTVDVHLSWLRRKLGETAATPRMLRSVSKVPVIVATARDDDRAVVAALDAGADDYVVKPFSAEALDARIRAVLRRTTPAEGASSKMTVGDLVVDQRTRTATLAGTVLDLRPREFDLLAYLAARPGEVVSKRTLLAEVWQSPYGGADKTVDVHLSWLRRKLGETAAEPRMLHTVRGVGVKLVEPT
jgi:DNA-binding response OmpR family regulator